MKTEPTSLIPLTHDNLLLPDIVMSTVSRSEIVNLVVVQYETKVKAEIAALEGRLSEQGELATRAWEAAYAAWHAQIMTTVHARLDPWHDAVAAAVGEPMTRLYSTELPLPNECRYTFGGVMAPSVPEHSHRHRLASIPTVIQHWTTIGKLPNDYTVPIPLNVYEHQGPVLLSAFKMIWTFAREVSKYADDFHSLTIAVDVIPNNDVLTLVETAMAATLDYQHVFSQKHRLIEEISEKNIKTLERRALARLTQQTLADGTTLPVLE
jgi:hypothetical protein